MAKVVFSYGSYCWVPDEDDMFIPAKVEEAFEQGKPGKVSVDGKAMSLDAKQTAQCLRMDEQSLTSVPNMVALKELNEASILHNLRLRFKRDEIYTTVGTILVSVNPFKLLPIYTSEILEKYRNQGPRGLDPHVYAVADDSYKSMVNDSKNQSCIVSGESGAGKTEATKIFLQYIAEISGSSKGKGDEATDDFGKASLQEQILKANPLMEAFGNAKTKRNNNSSRFGKWIEVKFNNKSGHIVGGSIVQYLLEKSRIVFQAEGERNYHIFYNLCAGGNMDPAVQEKFLLEDPDQYQYLAESGVTEVEGINDEGDWEDVLNAMEVIGISNAEQDEILNVVAAVLQLGNVTFAEGGGEFQEGSKIESDVPVANAAKFLGCEKEVLSKALTQKELAMGKDITIKVNDVAGAIQARDALAKEVYSKLFDWLIGRINVSLAGDKKAKIKKEDTSIIGVLDIFGFETFDYNSFEQLCINYCNEKLQYHFNEHIFSLEQKAYKEEGIDVSQITFADNQPTLKMLEEKKKGIFAQVDEEMTVPRGSDQTLLTKISKQHDKHPAFRKPGVKTNYERESFTVVHYAGPVMYNTTGFLEKNKDKLSDDLEKVITGSKSEFVSKLIPASAGGKKTGRGTMSGKTSIGSKFKNQLNALMQTLNATEPHFIRCIKPNDEKEGNIFTAQMVIDQLRYAGLLEVCRIRQIGYPVRKEFKDFYRRYNPTIKPGVKDVKALTARLEADGLLPKGEYQLGKTKVFMRNGPYNELEAAREIALKDQAILLQSYARRFIMRARYLKYAKTIAAMQDGMAKRDYEKLKSAIQDAGDLPHGGKHLTVFADAQKVLRRLEEEMAAVKLLTDAIEKRDYSLLMGAIGRCEEMKFSPPEVKKAKDLKKLIEEERAAVKALAAAISARKLDDLKVAMDKVSKLKKTDCDEWKQAETLKKRLLEEEEATKAVEAAAKSRDLDKLKAALAKTTEMGVKNPAVEAGERIKKEILAEQQMEDDGEAEKIAAEREKKVAETKKLLKEAAASEDEEKIKEAKQKVLEMGVSGSEVDKLLGAAEKMAGNKEIVEQLNGAYETMNSKAKSQNGIEKPMLAPLTAAVSAAKAAGFDDSSEEFKRADELLERMKGQLVAQEELKKALASGDFDQLKSAMERGQELSMATSDLQAVIDKVRSMDQERPHEHKPREEVDMDEDEFERQRKENMAMASHERYNFRKYFRIRADGDYVKNTYFNKKRVLEAKLSYQKTQIPRSIIELDKDLNKVAVAVHKSLLGYCGEQMMSFPATLAQDILIKGLEQPELVDEIYVQICKHLTNNPKPESVGRAWQIMCMCVGTFPPSSDFEYYLLNFLIEHLLVPGLVGNYARYSLRRLEGMLIRGASGFVPNIDEILAYKERPPILATIELVDGTPLTEDLPITPDLNVDKVLEICTHFLSLKDARASSFGIFVKDSPLQEGDAMPEGAAASAYSAARLENTDEHGAKKGEEQIKITEDGPQRTPRPLRGKDFMGEVVVQMTRQRRHLSFVFKRKLFLPNADKASDDPVYSRLMYLQAADEVIGGNIPIMKEADVVELTSIAIAADSEKFPSTEAALIEAELMEYIPVPWRPKKTEQNWARAVLASRGKVASKSLDFLQNKYVEKACKLPLYGMSFFFVRKEQGGPDMIAAISHEGIHFLSVSRVLRQTFKYSDIHRWGGSSTQFWLLVWDAKKNTKARMALFTSQARDMSALILDYALLAAEKPAAKKK